MSSEDRNLGGVPFKVGPIPGGTRADETWAGANQAKDENLRVRKAQRRADADGLELRHSDYGYALIGANHKSVNGRNDMSLREIESWLKTTREP